MPRDLHAIAKEDSLQGMSTLTKSPEEVDQEARHDNPMDAGGEEAMLRSLPQPNTKRDELHPYTQSLSISDVESCTKLEELAFPPNERCTREKFDYRLRECGELSLGIFTSHTSNSIATSTSSAPVYSGAPDRKAVLLGHIVATKTTNPTVHDEDMAIHTGHKEEGRTICIHSLAVLPDYQRRGLGRTLMMAYLQRIETQGVADRAALIAHDHLIPYYESFGFRNLGKSQAQFGGGGWFDMVKELKPGKEGEGLT